MKKGKIIVIEGTDCSGKATQTEKLIARLKADGKKVFQFGFPQYNSPTGKIVGGPYLGKDYICEGWFPEKAPNVDALTSICYYAADRRYHRQTILDHLAQDEIVILDRYTISNMAHQGGKLKSRDEKIKMFKKIAMLEFDILELPEPDIVFILYMPQDYAYKLKETRNTYEHLDQLESSYDHLKSAEETYMLLSELYGYEKINCIKDKAVRTIEDIHEELYQKTIKVIEEK